ncbi:MAG TPA: SRPBCC family protein [Nocardioides sp.]|uniref:SRPBCC family protein n=1 Tax=Nocardioides sp. TaxID=35761 RepID=UPI002F42C289
MDLDHSFTVPVGVETAWAEFQDIASVAECFPGATVTGAEGDTFSGSVKVKLGPIALVYNGSGTFTEKDEAAHRFVVDAKGKDKRGNGTAGATVTLTMDGRGDSTEVKVHTDLAVTGKPAQFGRGVMQDVSDKLLGQFVACLEQRLGENGGATSAGVAAPAGGADQAAPPGETPADGSGTAPAAESTPPPAESTPPPPESTPPAESAVPPVESTAIPSEPVAPAAPPPASAPRQPSPTPRGSDDALDLGRTVLPLLAKAYWKQAVVALIVIIVIIWLIAR